MEPVPPRIGQSSSFASPDAFFDLGRDGLCAIPFCCFCFALFCSRCAKGFPHRTFDRAPKAMEQPPALRDRTFDRAVKLMDQPPAFRDRTFERALKIIYQPPALRDKTFDRAVKLMERPPASRDKLFDRAAKIIYQPPALKIRLRWKFWMISDRLEPGIA